ncbi:MAG: NYN domain-containing protein [Planctomycetota bacterium]
MPLILDAYNLLHAEKPDALAGLDEPGLCRVLDASPLARHGITVVCDGRPKPHSLHPDALDHVELRFSQDESADAAIVRMVHQDSAPKRLTVVTDDRQIAALIKRKRARHQSCHAFLTTLARLAPVTPPSNQPSKAKPHVDSLGEAQTRAWLKAFGLDEHA